MKTVEAVPQHFWLPTVDDLVVSTVGISNQAAFTGLTVKPHIYTVPTTPTVMVTQSTPGAGQVQIRMRGYDRHDTFVEETSPLVGIAAKATNYVYMSFPFERVTEVAYIASGMTAGAQVKVGFHADLARVNSGSVEHVAADNFGVALPQCRSSGRSQPAAELGVVCVQEVPEIRNISAYNLTKGKGIQFLEGSYVLGRSVTGWRGAFGKLGFNGSLLEAMDQTVPGYSSGDQVFIFCTVVYDEPFLA